MQTSLAEGLTGNDAGVGGAIFLLVFVGVALAVSIVGILVVTRTVARSNRKPDRVWKNPYYDDEHQPK
jgi:hypothetical protein